ncbi:hypothetical protein CRG98_042102 [Punica granatum]|uniref:Uncharacterized protein n=1 Tax=Punica granatum TaxID=22663 RepID=A0A2I0I0K7_PUNGR|nr:hypothetical protein CRG98_042102 [Punica granatum]
MSGVYFVCGNNGMRPLKCQDGTCKDTRTSDQLCPMYGPECGLSSRPASRAFGSRGLGVSTFLWERVTDTREKRSCHLSFYDPKVEGG